MRLVAASRGGQAVESAPVGEVVYTPVTVHGDVVVVGRALRHVVIEPVRDLRANDRGDAIVLSFQMPPGVTEARVLWRRDRAPSGPDDPLAASARVTNTSLEIKGGWRLAAPADGWAYHVAAYPMYRAGGIVRVAGTGVCVLARAATRVDPPPMAAPAGSAPATTGGHPLDPDPITAPHPLGGVHSMSGPAAAGRLQPVGGVRPVGHSALPTAPTHRPRTMSGPRPGHAAPTAAGGGGAGSGSTGSGGAGSGGPLPRRRPSPFAPLDAVTGPLPVRDEPAAPAGPIAPLAPPAPAASPAPLGSPANLAGPASEPTPVIPAGPASTGPTAAVPFTPFAPAGSPVAAPAAEAGAATTGTGPTTATGPTTGMGPSEELAIAAGGPTMPATGPLPAGPAGDGDGDQPQAAQEIGLARAFGAGAAFTAAARPGTGGAGEGTPAGTALPMVTYSVSRSGWRRRTMRVQVHTSGPVGELILYARPGTAPPRAAAEAHELSRLAAVDQSVTRTIDVTLDGAQLPWGVRLLPALHPSGWTVAHPADEDLIVR